MNKNAIHVWTVIISAGVALQLASAAKPNVLFIMTDQQSHGMMSCAGNKWLSTPNMDRIAGRGYRFDRNYCVNPVCMPSRFSLLTGHYASEVGVKENTQAYDAAKVRRIISMDALGNVFRKAGYQNPVLWQNPPLWHQGCVGIRLQNQHDRSL